MRILFLKLLLLLAPTSSYGLCVQTFNAYGPIYAANLTERTSMLATSLEAEAPCEIIHFQEVWNKDHQDKIETILISQKNKPQVLNPSKEIRVGLVSSLTLPIKSEGLHVYKHNKSGVIDEVRDLAGVKKAFFIVHTEINNESYLVINTHLHPTDTPVRLAQLVELFKERLMYPDHNVILTGDFNFDPGGPEHQFLMSAMGLRDAHYETLQTYQGVCTYCSSNPHSWLFEDKVFDYVFYSKNSTSNQIFGVKSAQINLKGTQKESLSDHYGLRVNFQISPKEQNYFSPLDARISKAKISLSETKAILESAGKSKYSVPIAFLDLWSKQLEDPAEPNIQKILKRFR